MNSPNNTFELVFLMVLKILKDVEEAGEQVHPGLPVMCHRSVMYHRWSWPRYLVVSAFHFRIPGPDRRSHPISYHHSREQSFLLSRQSLKVDYFFQKFNVKMKIT
jgi:hypothetical protein